MQAVILDAGSATRMFPFNEYRTKGMLPVGGRPLLAVMAENLAEVGVYEIIIVIPSGPRGASLRHYFCKENFFCKNAKTNISFKFIEQSSPEGTAKALELCKDFIREDFLLLYGDLLTFPNNLKKMASSPVPSAGLLKENVGRRMGAKVEDGRIIDFALNPRWEGEISADYPLMGIFHLDSEIFNKLLENPGIFDRTPPGVPPQYEFGLSSTLREMAKEIRINAEFLDPPCINLENPVNILDARDIYLPYLASLDFPVKIHPTARIETPYSNGLKALGENSIIEAGVRIQGFLSVGKNSRILQGSYIIGPCVIGDDCVIGPYAYIYNADIGNGVHLGHCTELTGVVMEGAYCTHYSYISGVVGKKCNLGAATVCGTLRHDDRPVPIYVDGHPIDTGRRGLGAFFGDYCRTGVNSVILPGRMIGQRSVIDAGVVVEKNVPADKYLKLKQETTLLDWKFPM